MAWEGRGGRQYYYRKVRDGNRVRSEYLGRGPQADLLACLGQIERAQAEARRREEERVKEEARAVDKQVNEVCSLVDALRDAAFLLAGYHTHKGQWRKSRDQ